MKRMRSTEFVVSLVLVATLVGHVAIHKHFERRRNTALATLATMAPAPPLRLEMRGSDSSSLPAPLQKLPLPESIIPTFYSPEGDTNSSASPIVQAAKPPARVPSPSENPPTEITHSDDLDALDEETAAVRSVIEQELAHAPREEREIWFDELKSLPAGVVRDLLQVRKQLRALPKLLGGVPEKLALNEQSETPSSRTNEISAEPASQRIRFSAPDYTPSLSALESAVSQLRHNLANAATPGFKRLRVSLVDAYAFQGEEGNESDTESSEIWQVTNLQGDGCRLAPLMVDLKSGSVKSTMQPYDLAIDGPGFFVVRRGEQEFLTRCGQLTLDRDRRLCLAVTSEPTLLQPEITVPEGTRDLHVSVDGMVTVSGGGDSDPISLGQLRLADVASPTRLQPVGSTLFATNELTGPIQAGFPSANGFGSIQQGFLEQSNVDSDAELREIDGLIVILKSFPSQATRPATAGHPDQNLKR